MLFSSPLDNAIFIFGLDPADVRGGGGMTLLSRPQRELKISIQNALSRGVDENRLVEILAFFFEGATHEAAATINLQAPPTTRAVRDGFKIVG